MTNFSTAMLGLGLWETGVTTLFAGSAETGVLDVGKTLNAGTMEAIFDGAEVSQDAFATKDPSTAAKLLSQVPSGFLGASQFQNRFADLDPFIIAASDKKASGNPITSASVYVGIAGSGSKREKGEEGIDRVLAMPGMGLSLGMGQSLRLQQRMELKLELRLNQIMEQRQILGEQGEEFYDDAWREDTVPKEVIEIGQLIQEMSRTLNPAVYIQTADKALMEAERIDRPHHRMMAICFLAEELSHHEALKSYVEELYHQHFTRAFSGTFKAYQPALALMVAASQLKAGLDSKHVANLVERALSIAKAEKSNFRGEDARNFYTILRHFPKTEQDGIQAQKWVEDFICLETWEPKEKDIAKKKEDDLEEEPPLVEATTETATERPTFVSLSAQQKSYVRSRLIHHAMQRVVATRGYTEEVFGAFMKLATHDPWEETAAVAYQLLALHEPFQGRLENALPHFSSVYYHAKADWYLAQARHSLVSAKRQKLLEAVPPPEELLQGHESFSVHAGQNQDPLQTLFGNAFTLPDPNDLTEAGIERWASETAEHYTVAEPVLNRSVVQTVTTAEEGQEEHFQERKGELYGTIALSLLSNHPDDKEIQIAALNLIAASKDPKSVARFMGALPFVVEPDVQAAAEKTITTILSKKPYYQGLARVLLYRWLLQAKPAAFHEIKGNFLKAASEDDESVTNAEAIAELTWLAREMKQGDSAFSKKLLILARKRIQLYKEKLDEGGSKHGAVGETDEETKIKKGWTKLLKQSQAHLLSSLPHGAQHEDKIEKQILKLEDPFLIAFTYKVRAKFLANYEGKGKETALDYMMKACAKLAGIESFGSRMALGMEILDDILEESFFEPVRGDLPKSFKDRFAVMESRRAIASAGHLQQEAWFAPDKVLLLLHQPEITAAVLGGFLTGKQLSRIFQKSELSPTVKAQLLTGKLEKGHYQGAFDLLRPLLEAEEAKADSDHLPALHSLFQIILKQDFKEERDPKKSKIPRSGEYFIERKVALLHKIRRVTTPVPLTPADWHWFTLAISLGRGQAEDLVPLIYSQGLTVPDRIQLLGMLSLVEVVEKELVDIYYLLKAKAKENEFFNLIAALNKSLPNVKITKEIVDRVLKDPRMEELTAENIQEVVQSWADDWYRFLRLETPEERIKVLAENPLILEMYYRQEVGRYIFGETEFSLGWFQGAIRKLNALQYHHDHSVVERYEQALEKRSPTTEAEKDLSLERVRSNPDFDADAATFLAGLIQDVKPLTEADVLRLREIGREFGIVNPEDLLPPNRQRIYRLYLGKAPIANSYEPFSTHRNFVVRFLPEEKERGLRPTDIPTQFRINFDRVVNHVLRADQALKIAAEILNNAQNQNKHRMELEALQASEENAEQLAIRARQLLTKILVDVEGLEESKARAETRRRIDARLNEELVPKLVEEKSHWVATDYTILSSAKALDSVRKRPLKSFTPRLDAFLTMDAAITDRKKAIAKRLNLSEGWEKRAGDKVRIEMELLSDLVIFDPKLRERYLNPFMEVMRLEAEEEAQIKSADIFEEVQKGTYELCYVDKSDILTYLRIGDFCPCCIASNGNSYNKNILGFLLDRMTHVFAIYDPISHRAVGHMIGHFGLTGVNEQPAYLLNGLYIRQQHRGVTMDDASFDILEDFAGHAGVAVIRHGINPYHKLTQSPPNGFSTVTSKVLQLKTIHTSDGKPVPLYNDLALPEGEGNQFSEGISHYQKSVTK